MSEETTGPMGEGQPSEEEMRAALEEQMRRIRVEDVLLQTVVTLINLAARRLGLAAAPGEDVSEERDVDQARLAIEAVRALVPLCPQDQAEQLREPLSQLQIAYSRAVGGEARADAGPADGDPSEPQASPEEEERAKARSKIWTPPGS